MLARGKAFRPLAEYLVAEIRRAVPEIAVTTADEVLVFASPRPFAVLWISPRDLRLGLDLGDRPFDADLVKAKLPGTGIAPGLTHMLVLNDARQIGPALLALVGHAAARVNRSPPGA